MCQVEINLIVLIELLFNSIKDYMNHSDLAALQALSQLSPSAISALTQLAASGFSGLNSLTGLLKELILK